MLHNELDESALGEGAENVCRVAIEHAQNVGAIQGIRKGGATGINYEKKNAFAAQLFASFMPKVTDV